MDKVRSVDTEVSYAGHRKRSMSILISVASIDGLLSKDFVRIQRLED